MISTKTLVVVPTFMDSKIEKDESGKLTMVDFHNQYRYTLEDALQYIVEHKMDYKLTDILLYNVPLRDELRKVGMETFVKEIKNIRPNDAEFSRYLDEFASGYKDYKIADFDIQLYADTDDFTILNHTFHGLRELSRKVEMYANDSSSSNHIWADESCIYAPHVGEVYEPYPCFDSEDYANEDRTYQNYIIRDTPITVEDIRYLISVRGYSNAQKVHDSMPVDLLPMVYYDGDSGYILVATNKR